MSPIELTPAERETLPWAKQQQLLEERKTAWLASLKVGDEFIYRLRGNIHIHTIARVTDTQFVVRGGERFRRRDGRKIGATCWGDMEPFTDAIRAKIQARENRSKLESLVCQVRLSDEEIAVMLDALASLREKQAAQQGEGAQN